VFGNPVHPYTKSLIASVPQLHTKWHALGKPTPPPEAEDVGAGALVEVEKDHFVLTTGDEAGR
jgi:peptide/nickel transport system ATP-binding protein